MRSGNPAFGASVLNNVGTAGATGAMTVSGTINKATALLALVIAGAAWTWHLAATESAAVGPWLIGGLIAGLVLCLVTIFKKEWAPVTAPLYALAEGLVLGAISCFANTRYPGIATQAVMMTFAVFAMMLVAYRMKLLRATPKFVLGVVAATGGIAVVYLLGMVLSLFGSNLMAGLYGGGTIGIGFSVVVVIIAALNLVLDFAVIEQGVAAGFPKYMEWYAAFGLMVTLIWLYLEILRLLSKLRGRD